MGFESTTIYTIGTALSRAQSGGVPVEVLVEGQWLCGLVLDVDGHGAVIRCDDDEHAVIRMESVAAVKILSAAPQEQSATLVAVHEL